MPNIGPLELVIVLAIALIIFGPKRLPEMGKSLGRGIREFKDSVTGDDDEGTPKISASSAPEDVTPEDVTPALDETEPVDGEIIGRRTPS